MVTYVDLRQSLKQDREWERWANGRVLRGAPSSLDNKKGEKALVGVGTSLLELRLRNLDRQGKY